MEDKKRAIAGLILKANLELGGKELTKEFVQKAAVKCERFGVEGVRQALDKWVEKSKYMPKISELISECKYWEKLDETRHSGGDLNFERCEYNNPEECAFSRQQCTGRVKQLDTHQSRLRTGKVLCLWHVERWVGEQSGGQTLERFNKKLGDLIYAEEAGITADKFEHIGDYFQQMQKHVYNRDQDGLKFEHKGAIGSIISKMNTNVAGGN